MASMALEVGVSLLYRLINCVLNQLIHALGVATLWIVELVVGIFEFIMYPIKYFQLHGRWNNNSNAF